MIPNNPNMVIEADGLPLVEYVEPPFTPPPHEVYGQAVGGSVIDDYVLRVNYTNWYATPTGNRGADNTFFDVYRYVGAWEFVDSYDVVFTNSLLVESVNITFNNKNSLMIAFQDELGVGLCWDDPRIESRQTIQIAGARTPVVILDSLYDVRHPQGEVCLAYASSEGKLCLRWESEYFEIEHNTGEDINEYSLISGGMTKNTRQLQFKAIKY